MAQTDGPAPYRHVTGNLDGARYCVVDVSDNSTTVWSGPAYLIGLYVDTTLSAHALPIKDGTTTVLSIPASAGAGNNYQLHGMYFGTSLVVDPDDSGSGKVVVAFVPHAFTS